MPKQYSMPTRFCRLLTCTFLLAVLLTCAATSTPAQSPDDFQAQRDRAIQLINENKIAEALPIFERLAASNKADAQVFFGLGIALVTSADNLKEEAAQRATRLRGRGALVRAREMGVRDENLDILIKSIKADGSLAGVSSNKEANAAMQTATTAFAAGDYEKAAREYEQAARLDPTLYEAALYTGNSYYSLKKWDKAAEWFTRAIALDPERETAHRYLADALMFDGKQEAARAKFLDAIIVDPYSQMTWRGLSQWAERNQVKLAHPKIEIPAGVSTAANGNISITMDEKALGGSKTDGSAAWMIYGMGRASWMTGKDGKLSESFSRAYPNEKTYRHSLAEELAALRMVILSVKEQGKEIKQLDPSLERLVKLNDAGLLEPYILFARADQGIAQDFAEYRKANRDKLLRYLQEYVVTGGGK